MLCVHTQPFSEGLFFFTYFQPQSTTLSLSLNQDVLLISVFIFSQSFALVFFPESKQTNKNLSTLPFFRVSSGMNGAGSGQGFRPPPLPKAEKRAILVAKFWALLAVPRTTNSSSESWSGGERAYVYLFNQKPSRAASVLVPRAIIRNYVFRSLIICAAVRFSRNLSPLLGTILDPGDFPVLKCELVCGGNFHNDKLFIF